jgi:hypothetical protein
LAIPGHVPVLYTDARSRTATKQTLISLVQLAMERLRSALPSSPGTPVPSDGSTLPDHAVPSPEDHAPASPPPAPALAVPAGPVPAVAPPNHAPADGRTPDARETTEA